MPARHSLRLTVLLAILGFCGPLCGGPVRFLPLNEEIAALKIGIRDGKVLTKIKDLSAQKRTKVYSCSTGKKPITLELPNVERPDQKPATLAITFPPGIQSPLVLILPDPEAPSGLRTIAIEDSNTGFSWGSLRFFNTTDTSLLLHCDQEVKLIPGSQTPLDITPGGVARNMGVQLFKENDPKTPVYSAVWSHEPKVRKLILIVPGPAPEAQTLVLKIIPEEQATKK